MNETLRGALDDLHLEQRATYGELPCVGALLAWRAGALLPDDHDQITTILIAYPPLLRELLRDRVDSDAPPRLTRVTAMRLMMERDRKDGVIRAR